MSSSQRSRNVLLRETIILGAFFSGEAVLGASSIRGSIVSPTLGTPKIVYLYQSVLLNRSVVAGTRGDDGV